MALTVRDITDVVAAHPVDLPRDLLDSIIFALDDLALGEKENKSKDR